MTATVAVLVRVAAQAGHDVARLVQDRVRVVTCLAKPQVVTGDVVRDLTSPPAEHSPEQARSGNGGEAMAMTLGSAAGVCYPFGPP